MGAIHFPLDIIIPPESGVPIDNTPRRPMLTVKTALEILEINYNGKE